MNKKISKNYDLINLKLDLHNLEIGRDQLNNKNKIKLDSIKKLEQDHELKRLQFVNRIKFFDNFLLADLNKKVNSLHKQIESTRKLNHDLDIQLERLKRELNELKSKKSKINQKVLRYSKFFNFLNSPIITNHFSNDLSLIIDKYDSLILTKQEIITFLDERLNSLSLIKNDIKSLVSSEYLITTYETKNVLLNKLGDIGENIIELNQYNQKNIDLLNKRKVYNYNIELNIDYLYNLTCLMRLKKKSESIDDLKNGKSNLYASSISLFKKLDIIQYNLIHFSELARFNFQ